MDIHHRQALEILEWFLEVSLADREGYFLERWTASKSRTDDLLPELHSKLISFYEADMTLPIPQRLLKLSYRNILYTGDFYFKRALTILRRLCERLGIALVVRAGGEDRRLFILEPLDNPVVLWKDDKPIGEGFRIIHGEFKVSFRA